MHRSEAAPVAEEKERCGLGTRLRAFPGSRSPRRIPAGSTDDSSPHSWQPVSNIQSSSALPQGAIERFQEEHGQGFQSPSLFRSGLDKPPVLLERWKAEVRGRSPVVTRNLQHPGDGLRRPRLQLPSPTIQGVRGQVSLRTKPGTRQRPDDASRFTPG